MRENLSSLKLCGSDITLRIIRFNLLEVTTKLRAIRDHLSPFQSLPLSLSLSLSLSACWIIITSMDRTIIDRTAWEKPSTPAAFHAASEPAIAGNVTEGRRHYRWARLKGRSGAWNIQGVKRDAEHKNCGPEKKRKKKQHSLTLSFSLSLSVCVLLKSSSTFTHTQTRVTNWRKLIKHAALVINDRSKFYFFVRKRLRQECKSCKIALLLSNIPRVYASLIIQQSAIYVTL